MKLKIILIMMVLGFISRLYANGASDPIKIYPVPPQNDHSLFYINRSNNTNAIMYEVNTNADGTLNSEQPVHVFWLRYSEDSTVAELNYIQRKYAYGVNSRPYGGKENSYVVQFVSYAKKSIFVMPKGGGKYGAYTSINGKLAELKKVWIELNGGTFWFPTIVYVELIGKDPVTQQIVTEKFKPKR